MKLLLLDVDGTIADRDSTRLYPFMLEWMKGLKGLEAIALVSNQGGVGWRHWLETDPPPWLLRRSSDEEVAAMIAALPTIHTAAIRLAFFARRLRHEIDVDVQAYGALSFRDKAGITGPTPSDDNPYPNMLSWNPGWRKPNPGMLLTALQHFSIAPDDAMGSDAVMVGDRDEDRVAAISAGVRHLHPRTIIDWLKESGMWDKSWGEDGKGL